MLRVTRNAAKPVPVWAPFPRLGGSLVLPGDLVMAHGANATGVYGNVSLLPVLIHLSQVFYYIGKDLFGRVVEIVGRS